MGKTTVARAAADHYLDWDDPTHRRLLLSGTDAVARELRLHELRAHPPVLALDEFHKYRGWKAWLKGFFDVYGERCKVIVTGSSRLDVYRGGGDSLMGRYFLHCERSASTEASPSPIFVVIRASRGAGVTRGACNSCARMCGR